MNKKRTIVVGDIEGNYQQFKHLMAHKRLVNTEVNAILVGDVVGGGGVKSGNLNTIKYCEQHRESIRMVLGNKDLLVQNIINGVPVDKSPNWAEKIARKLGRDENKTLQDYFMNSFKFYIEMEPYIITHARPIQGKPIDEHTPEELIGECGNRNTGKVYEPGKIFIFGHHGKEGVRVNRDGGRGRAFISSIQIDGGCGKGTGNLLAVELGGEWIRILDSGGASIKIDK